MLFDDPILDFRFWIFDPLIADLHSLMNIMGHSFRFFASLRLCVLSFLFLTTISCSQDSPPPPPQRSEPSTPVPAHTAPRAPEPRYTAPPDSISQTELRSLLERGRELYWGITALRSNERSEIGGFPVVRIDPARASTMEALRARYRGIFTERAIDTILADFGVVMRDGKIWMADADGGDISDYNAVEIISMQQKEKRLFVRMSVPLGDGGEKEERIVRLAHSGDRWLIDSDAYGGEMVE
jgi:hypothetical protein